MPHPVPKLIAIPAGTIELRDARSESSRTVSLRPFEFGRTPVTRAEYRAVLGDAGEANGLTDAATATDAATSTDAATPADAPQHPVTWFGAVEWCNAASVAVGLTPAYEVAGRDVAWHVAADGYRLPTEAEWEWACRAGTTGATYGPLADIAWSAADEVDEPQPVAGKTPNALGLFDTLGNVWEWCWDYADTARYGDYRSLRGGGWADREWSLRASVRRGSAPDAVLEDVGFRVARGAVGETGEQAAQGWSAASDRSRADVRGPLPIGWTPLQ
ncbi:MAG TPA: SUMF1/EgtB/PvdO family nonheme iron enzyme [Agromyces sp.]|nr:SUMF1/EgtB/PvdO family nonheme iron enzyme [Agromyces sp.]